MPKASPWYADGDGKGRAEKMRCPLVEISGWQNCWPLGLKLKAQAWWPRHRLQSIRPFWAGSQSAVNLAGSGAMTA